MIKIYDEEENCMDSESENSCELCTKMCFNVMVNLNSTNYRLFDTYF